MKSKPTYVLLAAAMLALIVMPIAIAGAAPKQQAANASLKKQLRQLKQRIAALEGRQAPTIPPAPTTLPPSGPAGGDLIGTYPNPLIRSNAVGAAEIADDSVSAAEIKEGGVEAAEIAKNAVGTDEIFDENVGSADLATDTVGARALKGVIAVPSGGVTVTPGNPGETTVTCPNGTMLIAGGYAWTKKEPNSIITNAPSEDDPNRTWVVEGIVDAGENGLYAWANCIQV